MTCDHLNVQRMVRPPSLRMSDWRCLSCDAEFAEVRSTPAIGASLREWALLTHCRNCDHPYRDHNPGGCSTAACAGFGCPGFGSPPGFEQARAALAALRGEAGDE